MKKLSKEQILMLQNIYVEKRTLIWYIIRWTLGHFYVIENRNK